MSRVAARADEGESKTISAGASRRSNRSRGCAGIERFKLQPHGLVLDAALVELVAFGDKAEAPIKCERMRLCVHGNIGITAFARQIDQANHQRVADLSATPLAQNGDASDCLLRGQAAGADRTTILIASKHMYR